MRAAQRGPGDMHGKWSQWEIWVPWEDTCLPHRDTWVTWDVLRFLGVLLGGSKERLVCLGRSLGILMKCLEDLGKCFSVPGRCSDAQ